MCPQNNWGNREIELQLHRERPEVQQPVGFAVRGEIAGFRIEAVVRNAGQREERVTPQSQIFVRREEEIAQGQENPDEGEHRRVDSAGPRQIEAPQRDVRLFFPGKQDLGDEKARDDEEDIDTHETRPRIPALKSEKARRAESLRLGGH